MLPRVQVAPDVVEHLGGAAVQRQLAVVKSALRRGELRQRMRDGVELGGVLAEAILGGGAWGGSLAHMGMQMGMQMDMRMELRM